MDAEKSKKKNKSLIAGGIPDGRFAVAALGEVLKVMLFYLWCIGLKCAVTSTGGRTTEQGERGSCAKGVFVRGDGWGAR